MARLKSHSPYKMSPQSIDNKLQMTTMGLTVISFCELVLILLLILDEPTGLKRFIIWIMILIFPVVMTKMYSERIQLQKMQLAQSSNSFVYGQHVQTNTLNKKVF